MVYFKRLLASTCDSSTDSFPLSCEFCKLDTETLYSVAAQLILDEFGHTYTFEVKQQLMGLQTQQVAEFIVKTYDLPISWEEYAKRQLENTRKLMRDAKLMPGINFHILSFVPILLQTLKGYTRKSLGK